MRLGSCIALELVAAAGAAGGVWLGATRGVELAAGYLEAREANAATLAATEPHAAPPSLTPLPSALLAVAPAAPGTVYPAPDGELLAPLAATPVARVKLNHGGTSLSLRLEFASGARAAFKPLQTHPQSDPRREIAAYRIDRLLGIGHVPPAKAAVFTVDELVAAADEAGRPYTESRLVDEGIVKDGVLRGEVSWWIPEIRLAKLAGHRIDEREGEDLWTSLLQPGAAIPAEQRALLAQISACVLFDVLIDNADRWSGNNTQGSPDGATLYFMDNTLAFSLFSLGHEANLQKLYAISVFPRRLVERMRALTYDGIAAALADDGELLGPLLTPAEIRAVLARRDHMLAYIDKLVADAGDAAVLSL